MHRILYLSDDIHDMGGGHRQFFLLLTNLDRRAYEPVVVRHQESPGTEALRLAGIRTHVLPLPFHPLWAHREFYRDAQRLARFAAEQSVSLIHGNKLQLNSYVIWAARRAGVPSAVHVRAALPASALRGSRQRAGSLKGFLKRRLRQVRTGSLKGFLKRRLLQVQANMVTRNYGRTDSLIAISPRLRHELLQAGVPAAKIALISDCVDLESFHPRNSEGNVLRDQYPESRGLRVGLVGRIEPFKRQRDFVRAAAQILQARRHAVTFFLIGKIGDDAGYLQQIHDFIGEHRLAGHVILTGGRKDMPQVIGSLDVLVSLSGGSVMYEGMACGKPVLSAGFSTPENSLHLQDGKTGLLVSSRSEQDLVSALTRLLDDAGLRHSLGRQARAWAEANLSHLGMVDRTQKLYRELLGAQGGMRRGPDQAAR